MFNWRRTLAPAFWLLKLELGLLKANCEHQVIKEENPFLPLLCNASGYASADGCAPSSPPDHPEADLFLGLVLFVSWTSGLNSSTAVRMRRYSYSCAIPYDCLSINQRLDDKDHLCRRRKVADLGEGSETEAKRHGTSSLHRLSSFLALSVDGLRLSFRRRVFQMRSTCYGAAIVVDTWYKRKWPGNKLLGIESYGVVMHW
jgi:hypothetical protein